MFQEVCELSVQFVLSRLMVCVMGVWTLTDV